jgi:hypothetical protein
VASYVTVFRIACDNWPLGAGGGECVACPSHDLVSAITKDVSADPHDAPAAGQQFGVPVDVVGPPLVIPVLRAVVLHADLELLIPHINSGECVAERVAHHGLGLRPRQSRVDENQSRPGFLRRFRTTVRQLQHLSQLNQAPHTTMPPRDVSHFGRCQPGGVGERIQANDAGFQSFSAAKVKCCASDGGHSNSLHHARLVVKQFVAVDDHAADRFAVSPVQLGGLSGVDPERPVKRCRRQPSNCAPAARPEPCRLRPRNRRQLLTLVEVDIAVNRSMAPVQTSLADQTARQRLGAQERSVEPHIDTTHGARQRIRAPNGQL